MLFVPVQYAQSTSSQAHYSALPFTHTGKQQHSFRKKRPWGNITTKGTKFSGIKIELVLHNNIVESAIH